MARIKINDPLIARLKSELAEREVELTEEEEEALHKAMEICERAAELQEKICEIEEVTRKDFNDYEWARIYLAHILEE